MGPPGTPHPVTFHIPRDPREAPGPPGGPGTPGPQCTIFLRRMALQIRMFIEILGVKTIGNHLMVRLGDLIKLAISVWGGHVVKLANCFCQLGIQGSGCCCCLSLLPASLMPDFTNSNSLHWSYEERRLQESIDNRPFNDLAFLLRTRLMKTRLTLMVSA